MGYLSNLLESLAVVMLAAYNIHRGGQINALKERLDRLEPAPPTKP